RVLSRAARGARPGRLRLAQLAEQLRGLPHRLEAAVAQQVAGEELLVDGERAGVDVTERVDQAHHAPGPAQVQARQRALALLAESRQVEERVAGEHVLTVGDQPVVELAL